MKYFTTLVLILIFSFQVSSQNFQHLVFDGIDDHIRYDNASALLGDEFSMTGWFYTDALGYGQGMMGLRDDAGGDGGFYMIQLNNGEIECRMQTNSGVLYEIKLPAGTIRPQTWQHYSFTYGNGSIKMYLDGNLLDQRSANGNMSGSTKPFVIGRSICCGLNFYQDGKVDEVSLWSKELSIIEVMDIFNNDIDPTSENLELYYKFDQGIPGDNNTSITLLKSETGSGERDADIIGFALQGSDSNFGGDIDESSQVITFPVIENKLTTDAPFDIEASSSAGLPVTVAVVSGPATISGRTVTLSGAPGTVVLAANQAGDSTFDPATEIEVSFKVIDPESTFVITTARSPYEGTEVFVPELSPIRLACFAEIEYPELFSVNEVKMNIAGEEIPVQHEGNNYYTAWWTPPAYGNYELNITGTSNLGASSVTITRFEVVEESSNLSATAVEDMWLDFGNQVGVATGDLPCYTGAYDNITAQLILECESGGCGEWDRVVNIEAQDETGRWIEIIRYITPYGTACSHSLDVTDFASILHGRTAFRIKNGTFDNGYIFNLSFDYNAGTPTSRYSKVIELWDGIYPFGDMADLQPAETLFAELPTNLTSAKMKVVSTGHGWGDNNTNNAAEFFNATHTLAVDDDRVFDQDNWEVCNPNPDGCSPQFGTWQFNRAGWCPGAIARWFDYDMTPYKDQSNVKLNYIFNENYMDFCHPNNPNCVTNNSCNCDDGFNPELHVASSLVLYSDSPIGNISLTSDNKELPVVEHDIKLYPNPTSGLVNIDLKEVKNIQSISIINSLGQKMIHHHGAAAQNVNLLNLDAFDVGVYSLVLITEKGISTHLIVKE